MKYLFNTYFIFFLYINASYAQPMDKPQTEASCNCMGCDWIYLVEGLAFPNNQGPAITPEEIESVAVDKQNPDLKILEIYTKDNVHTGLKYMREKTNSYTKSHPSCKIFLDNQIVDNADMRNRLLRLTKEEIESIRLNDPEQIIEIITKTENSF